MADSANDNNTCVVCFKEVLYYSIGECDHPVCFECSTRMRVLCLQNECPICRHDLSRVVFTETVHPYKELHSTDTLLEKQYKIEFGSTKIKKAYDKLLENTCKLCEKVTHFQTFSMLSDHMRRTHEKYYCDLCVKHLKIFTSERKCYTRHELAHHRRKGDIDDTSHRGHPLCEFCEERFMDADELYRHLRKEHLYCHLCDADGRNLYYATHSALAHHFRTDHYLCEEGECAGEHLTAVFRSEIDLKAHKATVHGRGMPRGASRQARTLELQFNITPHPVVQRAPRERVEAPVVHTPVETSVARIDTGSDQHFPRLSAAPPTPSLVLSHPSRNYRGADASSLARNDRNFPALDGGRPPSSTPLSGSTPTPASHPSGRPAAATVAAAIVRNPSKPNVSVHLQSKPASANNFRLTQTSGNRITVTPQQKKPPLFEEDFPSLSIGRDEHPSIGAGSIQPPKVVLINKEEMQTLKNNQSNSQKPKKKVNNSDGFPALSSEPTPDIPPKWITVTKSKEKSKPKKPEPSAPPKQLVLNAVADFPTLPINNSKTKTKKSSQPPSNSSSNDLTKNNKKEKKKTANAKKENISDVVNCSDNNSKNYMRDQYYEDDAEAVEVEKKIKTMESSSTVCISDKRNGIGEFSLKSKEYPPLSLKADSSVPTQKNPPLSLKKESQKMQNGSVPPGFLPRQACDGMTFTNSSGQTFPVPVHTYIPPTDFEQRNRALFKKFVEAIGSADALDCFKVASRAFRDNIIAADDFYRHCCDAMGGQVEKIFPELVALLPDIAKQQELVVGRDLSELIVCHTCGQLLATSDQVSHDRAHWPPLASR